MGVAMNLKELAKSKGTNIKQIAEKCGIPASTLYEISNGGTNVDNVGIDIFLKVSHVLGMSAEQLMGEIGDVRYTMVELPMEEMATAEERELLDLFRKMGDSDRAVLLDTARRFAAFSGARERDRGQVAGGVVI